MYEWKHRLRVGAFSFLMAGLFSAGILLGGSEFVGFPWGPVVGAGCFVAFGLIGAWKLED